jgi:protease-4
MVLDAVSVVDRRRLKRRLTDWRIAAVLFAILFLGALMLSDKNVAGSAGFLPHIARIDVSGIITADGGVVG